MQNIWMLKKKEEKCERHKTKEKIKGDDLYNCYE